MAEYTYMDSNGEKWICDTIEPDGNGGYNYVQRIGKINSYNGEGVGAIYMSSTGALTTGATVLYVLPSPVITALSSAVAAQIAALTVEPGTNTYTATDSPEMLLEFLRITNEGASASENYTAYLNSLNHDFVKLAKLEFLNPDGNVAFALDNNALNYRSGAFLQSGSISCNRNNGPRRQSTVTLANLDNEYEYAVNHIWFGQQIRLSEGLILPDGTEYYIPQGVFEIENPQESLKPGQKTVTYTLVDKWANLDGSLFGNLEDVYSFTEGTNILDAMASLLQLDRFTMANDGSNPVDPMPPNFTNYYNDKTQTLTDGTVVSLIEAPYDFTSSSTGTLADMVIGLNEMIAGDIGYNQYGRLTLRPSQDDILDKDKPIMWDFSQNEKTFLGADYTTKNTEVYNDVIVVGATSDLNETAKARVQNLDPVSDTCVSRIGLKTKRLEMSNFYSNQVCEDYATWMLKRYSTLSKEIVIQSTQMFHIVENELITLERNDKPGSPIERHVVTGFTRPIAQTGNMSINCISVNDFPIVTTVDPNN